MKTNHFLKASAIGIVIMTVINGILLAIIFNPLRNLLDQFGNPEFLSSSTPPPEIEQMLKFMPVLGLMGCLTWLVPSITAGGLYAWWHNSEKPYSIGAVKGGAFAGGLTNAIGYLVVGIVNLVVILPSVLGMMNSFTAVSGATPPPAGFGGSIIISSLFGAGCGILFWGLFGMATGAFGGWVGDSFTKDEEDTFAGGDVIG